MNASDRAFFLTLPAQTVIALTICGEAEGEKLRGKFAVGFVIINRSRLWRQSIHKVCLARNQFECFNTGNKRLPILLNLARNLPTDGVVKDCLLAAQGVLSGNIESNIGLCTFYKKIGWPSPWFEGAMVKGEIRPFCVVDNHEFFIETRFEKGVA
jgi:hypothetical protein